MTDIFTTDAMMINNGDAVVLYQDEGDHIFIEFAYAVSGRAFKKLADEFLLRYNKPIRYRTRTPHLFSSRSEHLYDDYYQVKRI